MSKKHARLAAQRKQSVLALSALMVVASTAMAQQAKVDYTGFEGGPLWVSAAGELPSGAIGGGPGGITSVINASNGTTARGFKGVSQYDLVNLLGGSFIPPDTMGAVGATQFMQTTNGVYAIYNKATGNLQSMIRGDTFWNNAGGADFKNLNGDARLMFDKTSQKWIALSFGNSFADIQIAVSNTSDATGGWKATKFTGSPGGTADYPTLAMDKDAVYIGTNNFNGNNNFAGTTLNVISRSDLLGATPPTAANVKQFNTPYTGSASDQDSGYAIQGVNSHDSTSGLVIAASLFSNDNVRYNIVNPGTAGATKTATQFLGTQNYDPTDGARQPDGTRNIDAFDQRIASSVWEQNGKIYAVYGATPVGGTHNEVRWLITDAITGAIIQEGNIGDPNYDFYQPSLTINSEGQVVIGYNRSGFGSDGMVTFMAMTFNTDGVTGKLYETGDLVLHVSNVDDYHNGSVEGLPAVGRQRWGDYSAVTLDPNDDKNFWAIGEYAAEWNNPAGGHPTGSGGSRWGTWIADIDLTNQVVPEPASFSLMFAGLLALSAVLRFNKAVKG